MNRKGFEALADGTMLLMVLLIASTISLSLSVRHPTNASNGAGYAEDTRIALFRTTPDALSFFQDGVKVLLRNGTSIESFLRLEVHVSNRRPGTSEFREGNDRIAAIATRLLRPGWSFSILGGVAGSDARVTIPQDIAIPATYEASTWSYPDLDDFGPDTTLSVLVWLSPHR